MLRSRCCFLLLFFIAWVSAQDKPVALIGNIITPDKSIANGTLLIVNERIAEVGSHVTIPSNAIVLHTAGIIMPGLIDLHNHLLWNVLPRWNPMQAFRNRYEWLEEMRFRTYLGSPYSALIKSGLACAMQHYAEVKAITQGTTSVIGNLLESCNRGLVRNLDDDPTLGKILYNVSPLEMTEAEIEEAKDALASNGSLLIYLGEGLPDDGASAREFSMLRGRGLLMPGVSLIHALALKGSDFSDMSKVGVGFLWSPRNNLELYGRTANVEAAKNNSVVTALAPDWSATGSDGLLTELNFAATWNGGLQDPLFDDRTLVQMATVNAAKLVHLDKRLGALEKGFLADVLVLKPPHEDQPREDPFWSITHAMPESATLVMVGGRAVYGDLTIMTQLTGATDKLESIEICGV